MTVTPTEIEQISLEDVAPYEDNKDPDHKTHIVNPPANPHIYKPGMTAQDIVDTARLLGLEVVTLCGYIFIPKGNPENYDLCEICQEIAGIIISKDG